MFNERVKKKGKEDLETQRGAEMFSVAPLRKKDRKKAGRWWVAGLGEC